MSETASRARSRWAGGMVVAVIALVFALDLIAVARSWDRLRPIGAGGAAPAIDLPRIGDDGRVGPDRVSLASLRGRVVVVDFWETWCRPCRESMPVVERVTARHAAGGVALVSVCSDGTERSAEARRLVDDLAPRATLLADDGAVADRYGVATIPHLVVIARDGSIASVHRRYAGAASLERDLDAAIQEALSRPAP
ncbi:MAG TPA: redoxin family protein [Kofleriaceae bacterium]|nr:redoxin family protein [Kofleriaceae bacterium]